MPGNSAKGTARKCARCGHPKSKHTPRMGCAVRTGRDKYCPCLKHMPDTAAILAEADALAEIDAMPDDLPARAVPSDRAQAALGAWAERMAGPAEEPDVMFGAWSLAMRGLPAEGYQDG